MPEPRFDQRDCPGSQENSRIGCGHHGYGPMQINIVDGSNPGGQLFTALLTAHNLVRWGVLAGGIWAAGRAWKGMLGRGIWGTGDLASGKVFVNLLNLQFVLGLCVYFTSPLIKQAMADMGAAMKTASVRYFVVEHVAMMLAAIALAHIGLAKVKRASTDSARFQAAAIWWGLAAAAVAGFIPWNRPLWPWS